MTLVATLGVVATILGGIWFFALSSADRYWGLLAAVAGIAAMAFVWFRQRNA